MQCADVQDELVAYHFGSCAAATRDALHQHLRACQACAQSYFDLKQDIESGAAQGTEPSPACAARLRRDVEVWLLPAPVVSPPPDPAPKRPRRLAFSWLQQPMPRYRAVLAAAALCVIAVGTTSRLRPSRPAASDGGSELAPLPVQLRAPPAQPLGPELPSPYCEVDSARLQALSITYY
jgi:hypothetical protein